MVDIKKLTQEIVNFRNKRGWNKRHFPKNMAISLVLEAVEFLEVFQWTKDNQIPKGRKEELEDELSDVLYWVLLIAHDFGIDLEKATKRKMEKNKKRYPCKK